MEKRIAKMSLLDYKGNVARTVYVEYHSHTWQNYCSLGYITIEVFNSDWPMDAL